MYQHGFGGAFNSVNRFVAQLSHKSPEESDSLSFLPSEEMQVDHGEGASTPVANTSWLIEFNRAGLTTVFASVLLHKFVTFAP